jgi:hypothetical protein
MKMSVIPLALRQRGNPAPSRDSDEGPAFRINLNRNPYGRCLLRRRDSVSRVSQGNSYIWGLYDCGRYLYNLHMPMRLRTVLAFLVAPLPLPLLLAIILFPPEPTVAVFFEGILFWSIFSLPQAYVCELLFGVPAWIIFRRRGVRSWPTFAAGGIVLGAAYCMLYYVAEVIAKSLRYDFVEHSFTRHLNPVSLLVAVPAGVVATLSFRAVVFPWHSKKNPAPSAA